MILLFALPAIFLFLFIFFSTWFWGIIDLLTGNLKKDQKIKWMFLVAGIPCLGTLIYFLFKAKLSPPIISLQASPTKATKMRLIFGDYGMGLQNSLGQTILPPEYKLIRIISNELAVFTPHHPIDGNLLSGLIHQNGEIWLPPIYESIELNGKELMVKKDHELQFLALSPHGIKSFQDK